MPNNSRERKTFSKSDPAPHALRVTWLAVAVNVSLVLLKLFVGFFAGSSALVADGFHSASDLLTDGLVLWSLKASRKPADADHNYGHRRYQPVVAMFISILLVFVAAALFYGNILRMTGPIKPITSWIPFWIAVVSIVSKETLFRITSNVARRMHDQALLANAWHQRSDAFSSIPVAFGILLVLWLGPRWAFMDALMAVVLSFVILLAAVRIIRDSIGELTDRAPCNKTMGEIKVLLQEHHEVLDYHAFRARTLGGGIEMDFHIMVDPLLSVREGHDIATAIQKSIMSMDEDIINVIVHVEPVDDEDHEDL
ncbi:MAG TPA: cation diffusion facilitator family transporter [Candidatus Sumerlaeota bacterium]|nr:cation diffusion facilitator family transporter [Candidatus Sumerlaeota bacterium]